MRRGGRAEGIDFRHRPRFLGKVHEECGQSEFVADLVEQQGSPINQIVPHAESEKGDRDAGAIVAVRRAGGLGR